MTTSSSPSPEPGDGLLRASDSSRPPIDDQALQQEWEALRIQVAAVAAQQAALTEEETALEQHRTALERQEEQLAAHLEARNQKLLHLQGRIRSDQQRLAEEQQSWKLQQKEHQAELAKERKAAQTAERQAQAERQRLEALRRRLRKRWKQNFAAEQTRLRRLEVHLHDRQQEVDADLERFQKEKNALAQDRLAMNGCVELSRRELQEGWSALHQLQRQQEDQRESEQSDLANRTRSLDEREAALIWKERILVDQRRHWEQKQALLEKEAEGLENRVRNQRCRLFDQHNGAVSSHPTLNSIEPHDESSNSGLSSASKPISSAPDFPGEIAFLGLEAKHQLMALGRVAAVLSDQRLILIEHMGRLLDAWQAWHEGHHGVVAELASLADQLGQREQRVAHQEQALDELAGDLQHRETVLRQAESEVEALGAYLRASEAKLEKDRDALLTDVHSQEIQITARQARLTELRRSWVKRRRGELQQIQEELARFQDVRNHYSTLSASLSKRSATIERQARRLAEKALALEEHRLEILGRAPDAAKAERRMRRLRRHWAKLFAVSERHFLRERRLLDEEAARQDKVAKNLGDHAEDLAIREAHLSGRLTNWESEKLRADEIAAKCQADIQSMQIHVKLSERHLNQLRDELERLAFLLVGDDKPTLPPLLRAA